MEDYEKLLESAYNALPKDKGSGKRFEIPKFKGFVEGKTTVITNFKEVSESLRRDAAHIIKFLTKELATPINYDGKRAILQGKFRLDQLNSRLEAYAKEYVLCNECGKPDTSIITFEGVKYKRCEACGAKAPVKQL